MPAHINITVLPSAARTELVTGADLTNPDGKGIIITIDVTLDPALASITFTVQGKDPLSGKYYNILVSAAISAVSTTILRIYPGLVAVANLTVNDLLPTTWRVNVAVADTDSMTYSVGAEIMS